MNREQIIDRVKQLLDLERDQSGLPEGELAGEIAHRLMRQNSVAHADLILAGRTDGLCRVDDKIGAKTRWRRRLLTFLGKHVDVRVQYTRGTNNVHLYGYEHDVTLAMYLYEICEAQIEASAKAYYAKMREDHDLRDNLLERLWDQGYDEADELDPDYVSALRGKLRSLRNDFCMSAVDGLDDKLRKQRATAACDDNENEHALVVAKWNLVVEFTNGFGRPHNASKLGYQRNSEGYKTGQQINLPSGGLPSPDSQESRPSRLIGNGD